MIRAILFDFGNVIAFFDHRRATRRFASLARMTELQMFDAIYAGELEHEFESGQMAADDFVAHVIDMIGYRGTQTQFMADFVDIFTPNPPIIQLIPRLKASHRIVLASNTNILHSAHFRTEYADVLRQFDALGMSFQAGVRKPSTEFYRHCAALAEADPGECLFIDDIEANVDGARACGMASILYSSDINIFDALAEHGVRIPTTTDQSKA